MKKKAVSIVVIVLLAGILAGLVAWLAFGDALADAGSAGSSETPPTTAPVSRGSVKQTVTGVGEVKPSATEKLKPADSWHWLESFDAPLNKRVVAGQTLVTFANGEVWTAPYDLVVTSCTLPEKNKGAVTRDDHFIEVQRIDAVAVAMQVSENDLANVAEGQTVEVKLSADGERVHDGAIANVNEVGTFGATGSKFTVTVSVPNDGSIKLGMSANLSIAVAEADGVLTVPVSAVSGEGDGMFVRVYDPQVDHAVTVPVTTGMSDGMIVEVEGGIEEGDRVVVNEASGAASPGGAGSVVVAATSA